MHPNAMFCSKASHNIGVFHKLMDIQNNSLRNPSQDPPPAHLRCSHILCISTCQSSSVTLTQGFPTHWGSFMYNISTWEAGISVFSTLVYFRIKYYLYCHTRPKGKINPMEWPKRAVFFDQTSQPPSHPPPPITSCTSCFYTICLKLCTFYFAASASSFI